MSDAVKRQHWIESAGGILIRRFISHDSEQPSPIWQNPAWITAMVGLVTALFTIPQAIADYLGKVEQSKASRAETFARQIETLNTTLANEVADRMFLLRYMEATFDDRRAQAWASNELTEHENLLVETDKLSAARASYLKQKSELDRALARGDHQSRTNVGRLLENVRDLRKGLIEKQATLQSLRVKRGLKGGTELLKRIETLRFDLPAVLFSVGSADISDEFRLVLHDALPDLMKLVLDDAFIGELANISVNGHTSSFVHRSEQVSANESYQKQLDLSYERTRAVIDFILDMPELIEYRPKLRSLLVAKGFASSDLLELERGLESFARSNRVEIHLEFAGKD